MAKKSREALETVTPLNVSRLRLVAPHNLPEPVRTLFGDLVSAAGPSHFAKSDVPLLVEYCRACVAANQAAEAMGKEGMVVSGRPSPWIAVQEKMTRAMTALSMRLRLAPQSRMNTRQTERSMERGAGYTPIDWNSDE